MNTDNIDMMKTTATAFFLPRKARKVKQRDAGGIAIWSAASPRRFHLSRSDGFVICRPPFAVRRYAVAVHLRIGRSLSLERSDSPDFTSGLAVRRRRAPPAVRPRLAADTNAPWISAVRRPPLSHRRSLENWAFLAVQFSHFTLPHIVHREEFSIYRSISIAGGS